MKKFLFVAQFLLFIAFNFFLYLTIVEVTNSRSAFQRLDHEPAVYNGKEEFDPSLSRLNSVDRVEEYCDSIFNYNKEHSPNKNFSFENEYPLIVSEVIRRRFFHGYCSYGYSDNHMALLLEPLISDKWISAIVIPDDILNYPNAACSQQSIVTMELLKRKGYNTRMVGFDGGQKFGGHFCFEAFYNNSWHFFDTDQEPDANVLAAYDRPSIEFLVKNENILTAAYNQWDKERLLGMFRNYFYGKVNKFEAPNALIYQRVTKFLSYTLWVFLLAAFLVVRRRYLRLITPYNVRNSRISIPSIAGKGSVSYYSKNRA
ncbi:MAG: hypothetical protein WDO16_00970 [Bacteroidota bacterium]